MLLHFVDARIGRSDGKFHGRFHRGSNLILNSVQGGRVRITPVKQPLRQYENGIAVGLPLLFLLFGAVVFAIDVADVVSAVTVGIALEEGRSAARAGACGASAA